MHICGEPVINFFHRDHLLICSVSVPVRKSPTDPKDPGEIEDHLTEALDKAGYLRGIRRELSRRLQETTAAGVIRLYKG